MSDKLLRLPEILALTQSSKSGLYALMKRGFFPRPIKIGLRPTPAKQPNVKKWIDSRVSVRAAASIANNEDQPPYSAVALAVAEHERMLGGAANVSRLLRMFGATKLHDLAPEHYVFFMRGLAE
jgi:prophage regulatory protein